MTTETDLVLVAGFEPEQADRIVADLRRRLAHRADEVSVASAPLAQPIAAERTVVVHPLDEGGDGSLGIPGVAPIAIDTDPDTDGVNPLEADSQVAIGPRLGQRLVVAIADALARQRVRRRLLALKLYDATTGLASPDLLDSFLTAAFARHEPGDPGPALLVTAARCDPAAFGQTLRARLPPSTLIASLGADRIAVAFDAVADLGVLRKRAMDVLGVASRLSRPIGRRPAPVAMALAPAHGTCATSLIAAAQTRASSPEHARPALIVTPDGDSAGLGRARH